jgi:hypothetical protein
MPWFRFFPLASALALGCVVAGAMADTPASILERFNAEARSAGENPGNAARGAALLGLGVPVYWYWNARRGAGHTRGAP